MAAKEKIATVSGGEESVDQFVFVEVASPSNDNASAAALRDFGSVSPSVLFMVGEYIFGTDESDTADALFIALDGADCDAAEYAAYSSSVMFVFGDSAIEA